MAARPGLIRHALAFACLLASLALVIWRQSRALELMRELEDVRQDRALLETERLLLLNSVQRLESRGRVVEVGSRLGFKVPVGNEIVVLPLGGTRSPR